MMASRRMISTRFFKDPDIMGLSSKDTQLILIGLVLVADDEGREVAHAGILAREMDYSTEQIESALQELAANDLLALYQVGKHRYYQLSRTVRAWQTLGGRFTASRYPAPPALDTPEEASTELVANTRGRVGEESGKSRGKSPHFPTQCNSTEDNLTEDRENHTRKVLPFPSPSSSPSSGTAAGVNKDEMISNAQVQTLAHQVAGILKLQVTEALTRLVVEYAQTASLSLPGEADAAREWVDDPQRNKKGRRMSLNFFRNWLKRELEAVERRYVALQQTQLSTGTGGPVSSLPCASPAGRRPPDLMHLADEDRQVERTRGEKR